MATFRTTVYKLKFLIEKGARSTGPKSHLYIKKVHYANSAH